MTRSVRTGWLAAARDAALSLTSSGKGALVEASRYTEPDNLYERLLAGVDASPDVFVAVDIDHSRLAAKEGVRMPPAHVLMVSLPRLETKMIQRNQRLGLELPLRALAYGDRGGGAAVICNRWNNIAARHNLESPELAEYFDSTMNQLLQYIPAHQLRTVPIPVGQDDGIVTFTSAHDFETTLARARAAINAQGDTLWFGEIDFQAAGAELDIEIRPTRLLLFGGPAPGGRAMAGAPTLGLDAFCQKLLIWQGDDGCVRISFNDLLVLAKRQGAASSIALRLIAYRLKSTLKQVATSD